MRGAPITVRCDCGEVGHVPYPERWRCACGRTWNTAQIPADEYWGIMRSMRRFRLVAIGIALGLVLAFGLLAALVAESIFLLFPVVLGAWFLLFMPRWRRRIRQRARSLPKWQLHPE